MLRAGFIEAPEIGSANIASGKTTEPTVSAKRIWYNIHRKQTI